MRQRELGEKVHLPFYFLISDRAGRRGPLLLLLLLLVIAIVWRMRLKERRWTERMRRLGVRSGRSRGMTDKVGGIGKRGVR